MVVSDRPTQRLLVALDARPDYRRQLQRAAQLARALHAELGVLFIEDVSLFHLCELPTVEIALGTRRWRRMEASNLERELRARAAEARAMLEQIAGVAQLAWSFDVWRGRAAEAIGEAARRAELVSLGWVPGPMLAARRRPGAGEARAGAVVALYEGGTGDGVLDVALNLARAMASRLHVFVIGDGDAAIDEKTEQRVVAAGVGALWQRVAGDRTVVLAALGALRPDLLVMAAESPALQPGLLADMLELSGAQALLVRHRGNLAE